MKYKLFAPGPIEVPKEVASIISDPSLPYFASEPFYYMMRNLQEKLKFLFKTSNPILLMTGSGSLAMEQSVINFFSPLSKVLIINCGKYGENWKNCCTAHNLCLKELKATLGPEQGATVPLGVIEEFLKHHPDTEGIFVQHVETTTGLKQDIKAIAALVHKYTKGIIIVDAISSFLSEELCTDRDGLDVVLVASQKGLSLPPGLALMSVSIRAQERLKNAKLPRFYFNVEDEIERQIGKGQTKFTPAVPLIYGLNKVCDCLIGRDAKILPHELIENQQKYAQYIKKRFLDEGIRTYHNTPNNVVTVGILPKDISSTLLVNTLELKKNLVVGKGIGHIQDNSFRLMHFGWNLTESDIIGVTETILNTYKELKDDKMGRTKGLCGTGPASGQKDKRGKIKR